MPGVNKGGWTTNSLCNDSAVKGVCLFHTLFCLSRMSIAIQKGSRGDVLEVDAQEIWGCLVI